MSEEQYLPYWKIVNKKEKVVIVTQTGSISSHIHNQRDSYFQNMNEYAIKQSITGTI